MLANQYTEGEYIPKRPSKTKMAWEWNWPTFWSLKSSMQLFSCDLYIAHKGDHSPGFHCNLVIFNLSLLDFGYYNVYHEDWEEEQAEYEAEQKAKASAP